MSEKDSSQPTGCIGAPDYAGTCKTRLRDVLADSDKWMTTTELVESTGASESAIRQSLDELLDSGIAERRLRVKTRTSGLHPHEYWVE